MSTNHDTAPEQSSRTADTSGSTLPPAPDYSIDPADQALADQITNFDPAKVPSPNSVKGDPKMTIPGKFTLAMVAPEVREAVQAKLDGVPANLRQERESALIREHLEANAINVRIRSGPGKDANAYQREVFTMSAERERSEREILRATEELSKVRSWTPVFDASDKPVIDPQTGQQKLEPVLAVIGERRRALELAIAQENHRIDLLDGAEGQQRLAKAKWQAVQDAKSRQAQIDEEREARELGDQIARDDRIRRRAEARAKAQRTAL